MKILPHRVLWLGLVSSMFVLTFVRGAVAHEVQPAVADINIGAQTVEIKIDWVIEAPVAGIDLSGVSNTNDAEEADVYDTLRALDPAEMEEAFRAAWDDVAQSITADMAAEPLDLQIDAVMIPPVGDVTLIRISEVTLVADLPRGDGLEFGWAVRLGPIVVRQVGVDNGYTAFLPGGGRSAPILRKGGSK
ncbi:MAG: hypothetical protein AAFX45_05605 [Pseudomonadota bacterium]